MKTYPEFKLDSAVLVFMTIFTALVSFVVLPYLGSVHKFYYPNMLAAIVFLLVWLATASLYVINYHILIRDYLFFNHIGRIVFIVSLSLIMILIVEVANGQSIKEDYDKWLKKTNYTQQSIDSVNIANKDVPLFSPHRTMWDMYVNLRLPVVLKELNLQLVIRKEDEKNEVKLTNIINNLKKEVEKRDTIIHRLDSLNKILIKSVTKPSNKVDDLTIGDMIIIHRGLVINATKNIIITNTLFECLSEKMYKVTKGVYIFNTDGLSGTTTELKRKAKNYLTHIKKVDWDKVEINESLTKNNN